MRLARRVVVTVVGAALVLLGGALLVLPGPGILVVVAGLAVLATEYDWARRLLGRARDQARRVQRETVASPVRTAATVLFGVGMLVLGTVVLVVPDVALPFWGPVTGGVLVVTALVLLVSTGLTWRAGRREQT